jgi:hypothetical protein
LSLAAAAAAVLFCFVLFSVARSCVLWFVVCRLSLGVVVVVVVRFVIK